MEKVSVLVSGKLGDLIHSLFICEVLHKQNKKSIIYITDEVEPFEFGVKNTFSDLYDLIKMQEWCGGFKIWQGEPIMYNTTLFRKSPLLYNSHWKNIIQSLFPDTQNQPILKGGWMFMFNLKNEGYLCISRRYKMDCSPKTLSIYEQTMNNFNRVIFLGSEYDYMKFPLYKRCELVVPQSIDDWYFTIKKSGLFMGNQSSPLAMACSLDVNIIAELFPTNIIDFIHYVGEEQYLTNFKYFLND